MPHSVNLLLRHNKAKDNGLIPIYLRIIIDGQPVEKSMSYAVLERMWDDRAQCVRPGHPQADIINADITGKKTLVMQRIVENNMTATPLTAEQAKGYLSKRRDVHNIFDFVEEFSEEVKNKRGDSTIENYRKHALKLELFHGSRKLSFEEITPEYLKRFEAKLRETVEGNYISSIWSTLRTFFNAAKRRKIITCYPFDDYENPVYEAPNKAYLSLPELARMETYAERVKDPVFRQSATWFLFGCYSGLRISDWLRFDPDKHVEGDRITLYAKKNGELVTMPISKPLARAIARCRKYPLTIQEQTVNDALKDIAKDERVKIIKHLTSHVGRHTFAITICAEQGIGVETCAVLMAITVATCAENYYKVTKNKIMNETRAAWKGLK